MKVPNLKGYIEVPVSIFADIDNCADQVIRDQKSYSFTKDIPAWIKAFPEGEGVQSYIYKGYVILQGRA